MTSTSNSLHADQQQYADTESAITAYINDRELNIAQRLEANEQQLSGQMTSLESQLSEQTQMDNSLLSAGCPIPTTP